MEHLFLALLVIIMISALASGFPVAFAKATGKPDAKAEIIIITSKAKNKCSIF